MRKIYLGLILLLAASSFNTDDERNEQFITAIKNYYAPQIERFKLVCIDSLKLVTVNELTEREFNLLAFEIIERKHDFVLDRFQSDTSCVTSMIDNMSMEMKYNTGNYDYFRQRRDECASEIDSLINELPKHIRAVDSCKQLLMVTNKARMKGYLVTVYIVQHHLERPATRGFQKYLISSNMVADYFTGDKMKRYYQN